MKIDVNLALQLVLLAGGSYRNHQAQWRADHPSQPDPAEWSDAEEFIKLEQSGAKLAEKARSIRVQFGG